jgi:hypothetical protein
MLMKWEIGWKNRFLKRDNDPKPKAEWEMNVKGLVNQFLDINIL